MFIYLYKLKQTKKNIMQYQIQEYINRNVFKGIDELGNKVWMCIDLREGDTFHCDTKKEAVDTFVANWDNLNEQEKNNA
jgi:hypothetical protein